MQDKHDGLTKREFIQRSAGRGAIISALVSWLVSTTVIVTVMAGFLVVPQTPTVNAAPESSPPLDCISCHPKTLKFHDKLGSGNKACWVCHDNTDMEMLRLADETQLPLSDSSQLCAQCHQKRYNAWNEGTHGVPAWKEGSLATRGTEKAKCTDCHDPHQPQVVLSDITKPHPPPAPSPPPPPVEPLIILGISLLLIIAIGVVVVTQGKGP